MEILTKDQVLATAERALKTFAQTLVASILIFGDPGSIGLDDVDWGQSFSFAAVAAVLSLLTSVASWHVGSSGPSLGAEVPTDHALEEGVNGAVRDIERKGKRK